jgi:hypothetical protein
LEEEEEINVGWAVSRTASGSEEKCPRSMPGTEPGELMLVHISNVTGLI